VDFLLLIHLHLALVVIGEMLNQSGGQKNLISWRMEKYKPLVIQGWREAIGAALLSSLKFVFVLCRLAFS
jgi:hypothetical protein